MKMISCTWQMFGCMCNYKKLVFFLYTPLLGHVCRLGISGLHPQLWQGGCVLDSSIHNLKHVLTTGVSWLMCQTNAREFTTTPNVLPEANCQGKKWNMSCLKICSITNQIAVTSKQVKKQWTGCMCNLTFIRSTTNKFSKICLFSESV